jgi:hypothetical protein
VPRSVERMPCNCSVWPTAESVWINLALHKKEHVLLA